jgi:hypothetical protein
MSDTSVFIYPCQDIFQEAAERGIDANNVEKLLDEWEKEYFGSPDTLDDLIDGVLE